MLSKNKSNSSTSTNQQSFFARMTTVIAGVFSPQPTSPDVVRKSLERSQHCLERSEANIAKHKEIQEQCEKTLKMTL